MIDQMTKIADFIINSFFHIWPYLLVTIPIAVAVQMSGASKYIKRAFQARPLSAILLATAVGAFSPFCSCGVIPVIASLLISGVPLAPVMSFWIASPSMDPEIFFLSVGLIGWELAVWRLAATLILSLGAGLITHVVMHNGLLGHQVLRTVEITAENSSYKRLQKGWVKFKDSLTVLRPSKYAMFSAAGDIGRHVQITPIAQSSCSTVNLSESLVCTSCATESSLPQKPSLTITSTPKNEKQDACCDRHGENQGCGNDDDALMPRLFKETLSATLMVAKFMALAFLLEGVITLYVPQEWISAALGRHNPWVIITAAVLGVPTYTTSLTALPMISGLLTQGMNPAAALAFLVAGPITTLPAMAAVWPLVARRVFVLYISFALLGAILLGYVYKIVGAVFI